MRESDSISDPMTGSRKIEPLLTRSSFRIRKDDVAVLLRNDRPAVVTRANQITGAQRIKTGHGRAKESSA